jgi:cytochrome c5
VSLRRLPALLLFAAAACVGLPHPDVADVQRAQSIYPGVELGTLELGRQTYVARCSGCHALHAPSKLPPDQWAKRIHEMGKDAKLRPGEEQLIAQYLITMSTRSSGAGGR